jgi:hypothetical protein
VSIEEKIRNAKPDDGKWLTGNLPDWYVQCLVKSAQTKAKLFRKKQGIEMFLRRIHTNKTPGIYRFLNVCTPNQNIVITLYGTKKDLVQSYYDNGGICLYSGSICKMKKSTYKLLSKYRIVKIKADNNDLHIGVMLR